MKKAALKTAATVATAATLATAAVTPASAQTSTLKGVTIPQSETCDAVEIITVSGTGESNAHDDPRFIVGVKQGRNYTADIALERDGVGAWQTPYSSTVGMVNSGGSNRGDLHIPYGESRIEGVNATENHIAAVKRACPNTKFVITGFSQGASVAGDVAANINAGKIPGVRPEDLFAAYLISDPNRASATSTPVETELGAKGYLGRNGETVINLDQGFKFETEGLAGPRAAGSFANTQGRVMSFCHPNDLACSTERDGLFQRVGKALDGLKTHDQHYVYAGSQGLKDVNLVKTFGVRLLPIVNAVYYGDPVKVHRLVNQVASHRLNRMNNSQREAMRALAQELAVVATVVRDFDGTVPKFTGERLDTSVPGIVPVLMRGLTLLDTQQKYNLVNWVTQMMPYHLSYFTKNEMAQTPYGPWTVGGMTVDEYIYQDLNKRLDEADIR